MKLNYRVLSAALACCSVQVAQCFTLSYLPASTAKGMKISIATGEQKSKERREIIPVDNAVLLKKDFASIANYQAHELPLRITITVPGASKPHKILLRQQDLPEGMTLQELNSMAVNIGFVVADLSPKKAKTTFPKDMKQFNDNVGLVITRLEPDEIAFLESVSKKMTKEDEQNLL